ncbi:hypothetical protein CcrRB23_gp377 [Caulobacter phage RB23]|nr:hypothetical protein CcrRB23_gp377 [Caulobacter phage RB23]
MNVADFKDPHDPEGRTYRQVNAAKTHAFPLGALVEVDGTGARLFVALQTRDCDRTPLYSLSGEPAPVEFPPESFSWDLWRSRVLHGYGEDGLTLINPDPVIKD